MQPVGVYIHYPWCRSRCSYCDFPIAVAPEPDIPHREYLGAVVGELGERAPLVSGRRLVSVYFGGGTPSLWPTEHIAAAVAAARAAFPHRAEPLEVTLEVNPCDCTGDRLAAWRQAGVTRLSIGVQSFDPDELHTLGRDHRMGEGLGALERATAAGFASISADLILGVPGSRPARERAARSVRDAAAAGPDHMSVYELTFEEGTPLEAARRRGAIAPVNEDDLAALYADVRSQLGALGFEHYEISSYARQGHRAVHNSLYWQGADYLGVGNGACSFRRRPDGGGERWQNHRSVRRYLRARGEDRVAERILQDPDEVAADRVWLGLRTADGVPEEALSGWGSLVHWLLDSGLAERHGGTIRPTLRGFLHADRVARRVVVDRG